MKLMTLSAAALVALTTFTLDASAEGRLGGWRQNWAGGVTGGSVHNWTGPNGGTATGVRGGWTNGDGDGVFGSRGCVSGAAGQGCRAGVTTFDNGTVNHQSGFVAQGANGGSATSRGGFTRNADGTSAGARATDIIGPNGGSYAGQTTWDSQTGVTHTATCMDAYGKTVPCPTR